VTSRTEQALVPRNCVAQALEPRPQVSGSSWSQGVTYAPGPHRTTPCLRAPTRTRPRVGTGDAVAIPRASPTPETPVLVDLA
jgi:hypothetical protein